MGRLIALAVLAAALGAGLVALALWRPSSSMDALAPQPDPAARGDEPRAASPPLTSVRPPQEATPEVRERPRAAVRVRFESEPRDDSAIGSEQLIRDLYASDPQAAGILRAVRCTRSVCKLDVRWSPAQHRAYNAVLLKLLAALSTDITLERGGELDGVVVPVEIYIRRGRDLAEPAAALQQ